MTKTNKAFAYITNTAREDRKVARVLSGWTADDVPTIIDVATLDHASQDRLHRLQSFLFNSCTGLKQHRPNTSIKVLSVLTAYPIRHYPQLKELSPTAPIVTRVEECLRAADIPVDDMLAWSVALDNEDALPQEQTQTQDTTQHHCPSHEHLLAVIHELFGSNKTLAARLTIVESQNINVKGAGSVLRALRPLHKSGVLDERIAAHKRLLAIGSITDPAPADTQDILNVVGHV
ncbi:hypothetical protein PHPALM_28435 [Phytophthora palmivora]|uniref:Uncharacterized protein n=1 Tax=Phytophthora palmivora TaxID=4796 RepID=A0A2P4XA49_9STRA|nr:hypothetical protein PHPALM_28435 [Phytophthora palmivora]